jgi:glutathione S-transferase
MTNPPALTLYFHPLSVYCQKALVALYEHDARFEPRIVDLSDEKSRATLTALWPMTKFPVLRDDARGVTVPESSIIIEYLDAHYAGKTHLVPSDPDAAWECRLRDRFFDLHVTEPMSKIVTDNLRPEGRHDPEGVDRAKKALRTAYGVAEEQLGTRTWALGDSFTMADCAAAPALFYADKVVSFRDGYPRTAAYFARLLERPSFARVLKEAGPYLAMFPG